MQISLEKKFGWIQVHGGAIVKVAMPHVVSMRGLSHQSNSSNSKDVACKEGDLAVEIINTKTEALLGYTYLSGPAIQRNLYPCVTPGCDCDKPKLNLARFEPAAGRLISIPVPDGTVDEAALTNKLVGVLMGAKYGDDDLTAFELVVGSDEEAQNAAEALLHLWGYTNDEMTPRSQCVGLVRGKKNTIRLHFQPPQHAGDTAATPFQISLALSALGHKVAKPASRFGRRRKKRKKKR